MYSTLTRFPPKYRATPEEAISCVDTVTQRLTLETLQAVEYLSAVRSLAAGGIMGAAVYDALIGTCALKVRAKTLYTWNLGDFQRLGRSIAEIARTPG